MRKAITLKLQGIIMFWRVRKTDWNDSQVMSFLCLPVSAPTVTFGSTTWLAWTNRMVADSTDAEAWGKGQHIVGFSFGTLQPQEKKPKQSRRGQETTWGRTEPTQPWTDLPVPSQPDSCIQTHGQAPCRSVNYPPNPQSCKKNNRWLLFSGTKFWGVLLYNNRYVIQGEPK